MTTIRRIYAYLLAFAGLATVSVGLANLGQVLIDVLLQTGEGTNAALVRNTVALNAALALVGLPVWLAHWLWIERRSRSDDQERGSVLRRLYLYVVLGGALVVMAYSAHEALYAALVTLTGQRGSASSASQILRPLPYSLVALVVWLVHWRVVTRDRDLIGEIGGSATLRRWYLYGAAFVGLLTLLGGVTSLLETLWLAATRPAGVGLAIAAPVASTIVGLGVWLTHWWYLPERLPAAARRDDGVAVLRSVYLFLGLGIGVSGALSGVSQLLYYALGRVLGIEHPGGVGGDLLEAAAGPVSTVIVYGAAWAYQRQALGRQASAFEEAPRQAGIRRLYTNLVALIALTILAGGVAGLLWTLGDVVLGAAAASIGDGWRGGVALYATLVVVGLPVWLLHWRPVPVTTSDAQSLARRLYLYLSLIVAMLSLLGSAGAAVYRLISLALGEGSTIGVLTDLAHALAIATVAMVVAIYHWRVLQSDTRRGRVSTLEPSELVEQAVPVQPPSIPEPAQALVQIRAADRATLERALDMLRATGVEVVLT